MIRILHLEPETIGPYVEGLRKLEHDITYPLADGGDAFRIDHGAEYHPFFSNLGEAHFLVALDGDQVIGGIAGILRSARAAGSLVIAGYACDYKLARPYRGRGLAARMLFRGLAEILNPLNPERYRSFRYLYGAAMRGEKGDVTHTARGATPLKLAKPVARLSIYFVTPERLARVEPADAPGPPAPLGLDFSPEAQASAEPPGIVSTAGRKDLRLVSSGEPWPLLHLALGPSAWRPNLAAYLRSAGEAMVARQAPGPACFGLDERLIDQIEWLRRHGIAPGATATIVGFRSPFGLDWARPGRMVAPLASFPWIHLATSEI
jgi:hypothetical protein